MKTSFLTPLFLVFFVASSALACNLPARKKSYEKVYRNTYYDVLDVPRSALTELADSNKFPLLQKFKNKVKVRTNVDPIFLLKRQKPFFEIFPEEQEKFDIALSKKVGSIRGLTCLEAYLLDNHLKNFSGETEFSAYILTKFLSSRAKVIIYSQKSNGTITDSVVQALIGNYMGQGWQAETHLHNHPFFFNNPYGDIAGTILPSSADVPTYQELRRSLRLKSATVTNGFNTFVLKANEFDSL